MVKEKSQRAHSDILKAMGDETEIVENALDEAESLKFEAQDASMKLLDNFQDERMASKERALDELLSALEQSARTAPSSQQRAEELSNLISSGHTFSYSDDEIAILSVDSWSDAGYAIGSHLEAEKSLSAIRNIPLHTYLLRDDSKVDVIVGSRNFDQRRTRRHVGVIDSDGAGKWVPESDDAGSIDSSTVFAYNLQALSQLAGEIEAYAKKVSSLFLSPLKKTFNKRIDGISKTVSPSKTSSDDNADKWKSAAQLAAETSALEGEASISKMSLMAQRFKSLSKSLVSESKHFNRMAALADADVSMAWSAEVGKTLEDERETELAFTEALLDATISRISTLGKVVSMKNDTYRELLRLKEASVGEAERARERVLSEARFERETESTSVQRIRIIGEEATRATIEIIKVTFQNVADALQHMFKTEQGRKQILAFIGGSCLLAFLVVFVREICALGFTLIRKELMTPKLVREYGKCLSKR